MTDAIPPISEVPPALREAAQLTKLITLTAARRQGTERSAVSRCAKPGAAGSID